MKNSQKVLIIFALLFSIQSKAQLIVEPLSAKFPIDSKAKVKKAKPTSLALQKKAESESRWADCVVQAKANLKKYVSVKHWVMSSYLLCAKEQSAANKTLAAVQLAVKTFEKDADFRSEGPWKDSLSDLLIQARMHILENSIKGDQKLAWAEVDYLLANEQLLERSQTAKVYMHAGELAQNKAQLKAAQNYFEESLARQDSKQVRDKLGSVLFALGEDKKPAAKESTEVLPEAEEKFENRVRLASKDDDNISLLEDSVQYLLNYPNGRRARWAHDKVPEIYLNISDKNTEGAREQALKIILRSDSSRLLEWAKILHRRGEFVGGLQLSEKALLAQSASTNAAVLLYIAGRSAAFVGNYVKAQKYFEQYISQHPAAEDIVEVHFRLGLVYLRQTQASSAIVTFEKLLTLKKIDRYELSSMYWMVRSLQATNNPRALTITDEILKRYPFSYYGLRLLMERSSGKIAWPTALEQKQVLKSNYYLLNFEKKAYARVTLLAENNWHKEALLEANTLPIPRDAEGKVLLAQKLSQMQIFPGAIRMINDAGDINPELRSLDVINLSLPDAHRNLLEAEAIKQKLNPVLVKSLIRQESAFSPYAVSSSKAYGLMQLIGPTAQEVAGEIGLQNLKMPESVFQPDINIRMGSFYISKMISQFGGNVPLGLAAYNAGPTRMRIFVRSRPEVQSQTEKFSSDPWDEMWFDEIPWFETSFYVKAILRNSIMYKLADKARMTNPDERLVAFDSVLWADLVLKQ